MNIVQAFGNQVTTIGTKVGEGAVALGEGAGKVLQPVAAVFDQGEEDAIPDVGFTCFDEFGRQSKKQNVQGRQQHPRSKQAADQVLVRNGAMLVTQSEATVEWQQALAADPHGSAGCDYLDRVLQDTSHPLGALREKFAKE